MSAEYREEQLVAAGRGKWSKADVPHKGWHCVDIEDLGELWIECGMCESQAIRYVHHMEHPSYPDILEVGCICAGHMEGDVAAARTRETVMKSRSGKRRRWLSRRWRTSAKGNPWIKTGGFRITVYRRGAGWAATLSSEDNSLVLRSRRDFITTDQAKLAAFDHITKLLAREA